MTQALTLTLDAFLIARIAEDEAAAHAAKDTRPVYDYTDSSFTEFIELAVREGARDEVGDHIDRWPPARVLAECEAKRSIVALHQPLMSRTDPQFPVGCRNGYGYAEEPWPCRTLRLLALPYADHPDYRGEWRP